jgi:mannose-6-phosphate isomerase-like protein (cupin superfamily)
MIERINLREKLSLFDAHWDPKIVGELNGQHVKLVKFQGEFVWHHHEHEDELFLVVKGRFTMEFRDRQVPLEEGEFSSCLAASSIVPSRRTKCTSSCSSPRRR